MNDDQATGVGALIVNSDGDYLLHLRDNIPGICDPGAWSLIGGGREPGETLEDTLQREVKEEIGIHIPGLERFAVVANGHIQVFRGQWDGTASALDVNEGIMCAFLSPGVVPRLVMSPWAREVIALDQAETPGRRPPRR